MGAMKEMAMALEATLYKCCGSRKWAREVSAKGPFATKEQVLRHSRHVWWNECNVTDWFEAFTAHPRIGNVEDLKKKFSNNTKDLCSNEQSAAMESSNAEILSQLKEWNDKYYEKYGFIFIVFATGKSAEQVLAALKDRFGNSCSQETVNAAIEQMKITELRLIKMFPDLFPEEAAAAAAAASAANSKDKGKGGALGRIGGILGHIAGVNPQSPITSHLLDIANGKPAANVPIKLERLMPCSADAWDLVSRDTTNSDGRSTKLLAPSATVEPGVYKISFDTTAYEKVLGIKGFYPHASIVFHIGEDQTYQHFHVPLLYSPFGYSTYRGS